MFKSFLLAALLISGQKPDAAKEFGIIAGKVVAPDQAAITQPLQVVLMSPHYATMFNQKLQEQLDLYWERYKPAFVQKKELFFEVSRMAYQDSMQFVMGRMSRDLGGNLKKYRIESSADGKFEFKDIPLGSYNIVAYGRAGDQVYYWQEPIDIANSVPQFLQLKKHVP
jgi:hypothetical protein